MYLSRFGVKHYKCLGEIDIPLTPVHVVIGQNDAGKTSLLEAMAAFSASSESSLAQAFPRPWKGRELVRNRDPESAVELQGEWRPIEASGNGVEPFRYGFAAEFPPEGESCTTSGDWLESGGTRKPLGSQSPREFTALQQWKQGVKIGDAGTRQDFELLSKIIKPAHQYALDAKTMAIPAAIDPRRRFRMDPDGFGLATLLDDILGYDAERFIRLREQFCRFFPQFSRVRVESEKAVQRKPGHGGRFTAGQASGKGVYFETPAGGTIRAQHASDGAILFLGFLALAHLPEPPNLLLIEEPENGIYPKRLDEVISILKQLVDRRDGIPFPQVILTTHSPYVLSYFEPEEVTFLSREPGGPDAPVRARPLRDAPNICERLAGGDFYLGELWYNLSEEELFGEP